MDEIMVIPNVGATASDEPVPVVPTQTENSGEDRSGCPRGHNERRTNRSSRRALRVAQAVNFLLYGITLMIPGFAMIIVYFVVFRVPEGDSWSPADAFVITGAILVGLSVVAEVIGVWQFCMSRGESNDPSTNSTTIQNPQYSDLPPSYNAIQVDLPDLVVVSISQDNDVNPPSFETCVANGKPLPGMENQAFNNTKVDKDDFPPPPAYAETMNCESTKSGVSISINECAENALLTTSQSTSPSPSKDSS